MTLEQLRATWPGSRLHVGGQQVEVVRTAGAGMPLILLPGAQGTAETYYKQLLAWGARRPLVSVTYPALTDGAALADFVAALADVIGGEQFDLVGTSLGGYIAQWVAVRHPARVHRLVVGNSFCDPRPAQSPEKLQALQRDADTIKAETLARVKASPDGELKTVQLELMGRCQPADTLRARMLAVQLAVPVPPLGIPDDRILLLECDDDPLIPAPMRAALRAKHPGARHVALPEGGHYPYILQAEAYGAAVGGFLGF